MKKFLKENKIYLIIIIFITLIFNIHLPYYVDAPGGVININNRIETNQNKKMNGSLNMLYVTEYVATIPTYLLSYVMKDWDLENMETNQISDESPKEINIRNHIMLNNSIQNAIYVAYHEAGKKIEIKSQKNYIVGTTESNEFQIGDEILELDGQKIKQLEDIKTIIEQKEIKDKLKVKIIRSKKEKEIEAEILNVDNKKALGIVVMTNYEYKVDPPVKLKFKSSESGSSGGLMMALCIYNAIQEEDLLKGRKIAGTGTIDINGNVGEISGIKYKIIGAAKNNIDLVFVPKENYQEAISVAKEKNYKMKIIRVETFWDAISYLQKSTN